MKWKHIHIFLWSKVNLLLKSHKVFSWGFPSGSAVKNLSVMQERHRLNSWVRKISWRRVRQPTPLVWKIPWTEQPGGLWSMGLQRVGYDWRDGAWMQGDFLGPPWEIRPFFFLLRCLWYRPFWKSLLNLLQSCFCFMFWFFGFKACGILTT